VAYCTPADMNELFGETEMLHLTNLYDPDAVVVDEVRVQAAANWAAQIIDTYLAARYDLPLASVPVVLKGYAADMARYQLDSISPRDDVRKRYDDALKWLAMVAQGRVELGLSDAGAEVGPQGTVRYMAPARVFDADTLRNF
jgi:phage gp36-like protein